MCVYLLIGGAWYMCVYLLKAGHDIGSSLIQTVRQTSLEFGPTPTCDDHPQLWPPTRIYICPQCGPQRDSIIWHPLWFVSIWIGSYKYKFDCFCWCNSSYDCPRKMLCAWLDWSPREDKDRTPFPSRYFILFFNVLFFV